MPRRYRQAQTGRYDRPRLKERHAESPCRRGYRPSAPRRPGFSLARIITKFQPTHVAIGPGALMALVALLICAPERGE